MGRVNPVIVTVAEITDVAGYLRWRRRSSHGVRSLLVISQSLLGEIIGWPEPGIRLDVWFSA